MDRTLPREWYCFLLNKAGEYYSSVYNNMGQVVVSVGATKKPLEMNPSNLKEMQLSFGTNKNYFSGVRALMMDFLFVGDGADIIRYLKYTGKGYAGEMYFRIERFNPYTMVFEVYYYGRFDLAQTRDRVTGYSVPVMDNSAWGILSQNDDVKYAINCNAQDTKTIPVVFDGITLRGKFTYQPTASEFVNPSPIPSIVNDVLRFFTMPLNVINVDGDSFGIITQNLGFHYNEQQDQTPSEWAIKFPQILNFIKTTRAMTFKIRGQYTFDWMVESVTGTSSESREVGIWLMDNLGNMYPLVLNFLVTKEEGVWQTYTVNIDGEVSAIAGRSFGLFIIPESANWGDVDIHFIPHISNIVVTADTKADSTIVYCKRPLDVLREVVGRASHNQFVVNSAYFEANPNIVLTCGDAIRNSSNSQIKTSFKDWFKAYDVDKFIAFKIDGKIISIEQVPVIYDPSTNLFDIGEVKDVEVEDAFEYLCNEIELNMNKQDYRHASGRFEFNGLNTFSILQYNVKNKLSLVSPYRKDCYGMEFIRMDYQQESSEDNSGDDTVFMVDISNQKITTQTLVNNFIIIEVNNSPLAPIIYYPFQNDIINNDKPVMRGVCQPSTAFNVYADGVLDGTGTSDANGVFAYNVITALSPFQEDVNSGIHTIEMTFSDLTGVVTSRTVTIMDAVTPPSIENIHSGDYLYDNKPLIRGFLETGQTATLNINGTSSVIVTGDGNCRWSHQSPILPEGLNFIGIASYGVSFNVQAWVNLPLITSFPEGFHIQDNTPLLKGVAKPSTVVKLYLDYYEDVPLGTTTSDINGAWTFQVVPVNKTDGTPLAPIPNGNHTISTSVFIDAVPVTIQGYKLNRPAYTSVEAVIDNSVFNTLLTPKRNLLTRMPYWKSIFYQQPDTVLKFETGDKNPGFAVTIGGVRTAENTDVKLADYPDSSLFYPYIFHCTVETPFFFADTVAKFSSGGLVKFKYQGLDIHCLPIGKMSVEDVSRNVQKWSLLVSTQTPLANLMKLSNPGVTFTIMGDSIYRSDYNTLHMVKYDSEQEAPELHEDWFANRNEQWVNNPQYVQKIQLSEIITDQVITNFAIEKEVRLLVFDSCGTVISTYTYANVTPSPVTSPEVLKQVVIDFSLLGEGDYYFVLFVDDLVAAISEMVSVKEKHYGTILIDGGSLKNKPGTVFSNGFRSQIRVEGLVEKWVGSIDTLINEDEIGDFDNLRSLATKKRTVLFGNGTGIPDWLYLKICNTILLDDLAIQGVKYVISKDARVEPVEKIAGYPMYYYSMDFTLKENQAGYAFSEFKPYASPMGIVSWGWSDTPFTEANIDDFVFQKSATLSNKEPFNLDYTPASVGKHLALRYPVNFNEKNKWFNSIWNYGVIPDQVFYATYAVGGFKYTYTRVIPVFEANNQNIKYS